MKLLEFVPLSVLDTFYNLIKSKFKNDNKKFFEYFDKYYMGNRKFKRELWNYNNTILSNSNREIVFYANNICESFNRTLNKKYIGYCKTMYNFKMCIYDILQIYEKHSQYKDKQISITRALEHYVKVNNVFDLIS